MIQQQHNTSVNDLPRNPQSEELREYQLGIEPYVKGLVNFLKGTVTPMTVALQGEWGSGKTSLMYKLKDELCDAADAPTMPCGSTHGSILSCQTQLRHCLKLLPRW